jgi:hypothetical protein
MVNGRRRPVNSLLRGSGSTFLARTAQVPAAAFASYPRPMLGRLQDRRGDPNLRTRLLAVLVIVGMVVLTAPLVMIPIARWIARLV